MKKKMSLGVTIALMAITAAITLSLTYQFAMQTFNERVHSINERQQMYTKLQEIDQKVRQNYYGTIDENLLNDSIASGYVKGISDAHSYYLTAANYKKMQSELSGNTVGIGAEYQQKSDGTIQIIHIDAASPAEVGGLKKGDILLAVDDKTVEANGANAVIAALAGELGQKVKLTVQRGEEIVELELTRNQFEIISVEHSILSNNIGYIKIIEFNENTYEQFKNALGTLKQSGVTGLVLDVRNNPGGTLESVSYILDSLLPAGNIVFSEDKTGVKKVLYTSDSQQIDLPLAVLVNKNTASAAELLASAIKDYKKGTIIGETTYGKGTMQQLFGLSDGSALNITIAKFYPPISDNFDGIGVTPDIPIQLPDELEEQFYFLTEENDTQLKAATSALIAGGLPSGGEGEGGITVSDGAAESMGEQESPETSSSDTESKIAASYESCVYGRF